MPRASHLPASALPRRLLLVAGLLWSSLAGADPRGGRWAHETSRLSPDPAVQWGRLDNGLRYALLPHSGLRGRATIRLVVLAGSIDEREEERGLAHFIEHMAFRGTAQFPPKAMTALFERLGFEWGADVNAVTAFDYTAYTLDFRQTEPALLEDGLRLLRDFAGEVKFEPSAIERERQVILAELRARDGLSAQQQHAAFPVIFPGLRFTERIPGGTPDHVLSFQRPQFLDFYGRLYRTDLMVVVAAGDFDPAALQQRIETLFGDLPRPRGAMPRRDEGRLRTGRGFRVAVQRTSVPNQADILLASAVPASGRADSREAVIERQQREFVAELLTNRLRGTPGVGQANANYESVMGHDALLVSGGGSAEDWGNVLAQLDRAVRQVLQSGFSADEIDRLRRRQLRLVTHSLEHLGRTDAMALVEDLADSITEHRVYVAPAQRLAWMREWLTAITSRDLQGVLRSLWTVDNLAVLVAGDVDINLKASDVERRLRDARRGGTGSLLVQDERRVEFNLPDWGAPGRVVERLVVPELEAQLLRWQNQVRTNFAPRTDEPRIVHAVVRVGSGLLTLPPGRPALREFGLNTLLSGGTIHHNAEQIGAIVRERLLNFSLDVDDHDAFTFRGTMAAENVEVFLGLVAGFLHSPRFSPDVHRTERMRASMARSAGAIGLAQGKREWTDHLFRGDARFVSATPLDYIGLGVNDVRAWMEEPFRRGYVEATLVGDISEDAAERALARTLGTLPARAPTKQITRPDPPVRVTIPGGSTRLEFVGENHLALAVGAWPVEGDLTVRDEAALHLLARILEGRLREVIREERGLAYSPSARFTPYRGFPGFAVIEAHSDCAPIEAARVGALTRTIAADLAAGGIREGEFMGAQGVLSTRMRQALGDNAFILNLLMRAQERPTSLADALALAAGAVNTVERAEVEAWAAKVLVPANGRAAGLAPKPLIGILDVRSP
jgi:zinc protease